MTTGRLERLLALLQSDEEHQVQLRLDALLIRLAGASGFRPATIQAFFAKGLEGHVIHGGSDGTYYVMGAGGMSPGDLRALLGRRLAAGRGVDSCEAWTAALRRLAEIGLARGYVADATDGELMRDALETD